MINPFTQGAHILAAQKQHEDLQKREHLQNRFRDQVLATFLTPHGEQLLQTLEELYLLRPVCPPGSPEGYGYMREGENSLIMRFKNIIKNQGGDK